jgi:hypothetical protein
MGTLLLAPSAIIRNRKSKKGEYYNDQKKKYKRTNTIVVFPSHMSLVTNGFFDYGGGKAVPSLH